jgi:hypothetical protein
MLLEIHFVPVYGLWTVLLRRVAILLTEKIRKSPMMRVNRPLVLCTIETSNIKVARFLVADGCRER